MIGPQKIKHGLFGYTVGKCRCEVCKAANNAYQREWYAKRHPEAKRLRHGARKEIH